MKTKILLFALVSLFIVTMVIITHPVNADNNNPTPTGTLVSCEDSNSPVLGWCDENGICYCPTRNYYYPSPVYLPLIVVP